MPYEIDDVVDSIIDMIDERLEEIDYPLDGSALDEVRDSLQEQLESAYVDG